MSLGESNTRCKAIVNSTIPRFEPRWPPLFSTVSTRSVRISEERVFNSCELRLFRSSGKLIESKTKTVSFYTYRQIQVSLTLEDSVKFFISELLLFKHFFGRMKVIDVVLMTLGFLLHKIQAQGTQSRRQYRSNSD